MSGLPTKYLKDYQEPLFLIESTELKFELGECTTVVHSKLLVKRNGNHNKSLILNGEQLRLIDISIDSEHLMPDSYKINSTSLEVLDVPDEFELSIKVEINPTSNKSLTGLYKSNSTYCTQCESHGFRRITYYLDRPDVLSIFTTTIVADDIECPVLLSNGNKVDSGKLHAGLHWVKWHDPHPKPSYLFALVAGNLDKVSDKFTTSQDRTVDLEIYVEPGKAKRAIFALNCLKRAMKWDEEVFNRVYDLDIYMIVAVNDFNFGAMENKGLNVFNDKYILACSESACDEDFLGVDVVIAHEYFHNWSGNRVTCRDWFQLSLKEGLTVFREQKYTEFISSKQLERIKQARIIEEHQFKEDSGPMAHPIRPTSYVDMNNFYTVTVYNKGSEVIRMLETMTSEEKFIKGTDAYFSKFDGKAVTTDDFLTTMSETLELDTSTFRYWYEQSGTPELSMVLEGEGNYNLIFKQKHISTANESIKRNLHIPILFSVFSESGEQLMIPELSSYKTSDGGYLVNLTSSELKLSFTSKDPLIIAALDKFSAPVRLIDNLSIYQRLVIAKSTKDGYQKFKQLQKVHLACIDEYLQSSSSSKFSNVPDMVIDAHELILLDESIEPGIKPEILAIPNEANILEERPDTDVDRLIEAVAHFKSQISKRLSDTYLDVYSNTVVDVPYHFSAEQAGKRSLRNYCLKMLNNINEKSFIELANRHYEFADNMTDKMAALVALSCHSSSEFYQALDKFYQDWKHEPLVIDKWLAIQASANNSEALNIVKKLIDHDAYDSTNPNRVRALIGVFSQKNFAAFHCESGDAYAFLVEQVIKIQSFNSQLAARIVTPLLYWNRFDKKRQDKMRAALNAIASYPGMAEGVLEPVNRAIKLEEFS